MSQNALARAISVPPRRINAAIQGSKGITTDTSVGPWRYFDMDHSFFLERQTEYDMRLAKKRLAADLDAIVPSPRARGPIDFESEADAADRRRKSAETP